MRRIDRYTGAVTVLVATATLWSDLRAAHQPAAPPPAPSSARPSAPAGAQQPQPTFRSDVDLVIVEATAVDRKGVVVKGLGVSDFQVEIGGRAREVVTAELVEHDNAPATPRAEADISSNLATAKGRLILLVVDQSSLNPESRAVLDGAKRWIATLGAGDRVGLVALPPPGVRVEFTTDHAKVTEAFGRIIPSAGSGTAPMSDRNVSLWEAIRINQGDSLTRNEVIGRECRPSEPMCPSEVDMSARDIAVDAQLRVQPVLATMRGLLRGLGRLPGPKHVILISSGWGIDEAEAATALSTMAADAALANVTVHSFTAERWAMSAAVSRPSPRMNMDQNLLLTSVEMLSGMTGGRAARLVGSGESAFKSLSAGLSGYYRLAVRPAPEDLDGKSRRISVKVTQTGVSLAGYRKVMAGAKPGGAKTTKADPTTELRSAVRSNTPLTGLDLRATSYVLHGTEGPSTLRLVVVGDISRASQGTADVLAVLYDLDGKAATAADLALDIPADAPGRLVAGLAVKPGSYTLRLAVRDAEGKIGSIERSVDVKWLKAGGVETTGLVLFRAPATRGSAPQPLLDVVSVGERLIAQVAFSTAVTAAKTQVTFDVLSDGTSAPLVHLNGRLGRTSDGTTLAQEIVPVSLLPPGRYTISAAVLPGSTPPFTRAFVVEAAAPTPADTNASAGAGTTPAAGGATSPGHVVPLSLAKPPRFSTSTVLDPAFLAPAFEQLAKRSETAAVRDALELLKTGPWPTDGDKSPVASVPVAAAFVSGLGRLQQGDLEEAANAFRATLRAAPDFVPAMVYLGACYAAGAKDKEAASAWQTASLRDRDSVPLHRLAIEAWLRADRPTTAVALIKQARQRWPDDQAFLRLEAQAALADGKRQEGLELASRVTEPDEPLLLLSLGTLYEAARDKSPVWDAARDLELMRKMRDAYAGIKGQSLTLVDAWLVEASTAVAPHQP